MKDFPFISEPHQFSPTIKVASRTIDIDIEQPIDISQMTVHECSVMPVERDNQMKFLRKTELRTFDNEGELITVTITRLSNKRPPMNKEEL